VDVVGGESHVDACTDQIVKEHRMVGHTTGGD
jgi:hypothetical protein